MDNPKSKEQALAELDEICEGVMAERGSLRSSIAYCYEVRRGVEACLRAGCPKLEIDIILTKYNPDN
jgi:hypothetical protein